MSTSSSGDLRTLSGLSAEGFRPLSICIVTFEAIGFWHNGGIATVSTGLAELLAAAGHHVTLALTRADSLAPEAFQVAARRYEEQGIDIVPISRGRVAPLEGPLGDFTAWERYAVYDWLKTQEFDVVHSSEHLGEAFYCIAAKKLGLAFRRTQFWVGCHGPSAWVIEANEELATEPFWIWTDASERFVLREADLVWTPSRYLLGWMKARGFSLPDGRVFQQTYFIPDDLDAIRDRERAPPETTHELIFFGRLEPRKGLKLFVAAVLALKDRLQGVSITFMGRRSTVDGMPAGDYIASQLATSGLDWKILDDLDREAAYGYVVGAGRVAVLASPVDNSPCAVYELLEIGARFVACAGGGIPELIDPSCHDRVLFSFTLDSLVQRLSGLLVAPPDCPTAAPSLDRAATVEAWRAAHVAIASELAGRTTALPAAPQDSAVVAIVVDAADEALASSIAAVLELGALVRDVVLIVSDRRVVLPAELHPELKRLSLDAMSSASIAGQLGQQGRPVILMRSGTILSAEACGRLLEAARGADAVVPFSFRDMPDMGRVTEPLLCGDWSWSTLYSAAPVGGVFSSVALSWLSRSIETTGTNPLLWFDLAVLEGLNVVPLAEPLLDATAVNRGLHGVADTRARRVACAVQLTPGQRVSVEVAYTALLRPPPAQVPAAEPSTPEHPASPPPAKGALSRLVGKVRRTFR